MAVHRRVAPGSRGRSLRGALSAVAADPASAAAADRVARHVREHGWEPLVTAATAHGIPGALLRAVHRCGLSEEPGAATLVSEARRSALRRARTLIDLATVRAAVGHSVTVLKGPALGDLVYESTDLRSFVDLDVLLLPEEVPSAVAALEDRGCDVLDANWPLMRRLMVTQLRVLSPSGGLVDLHWDLLNAGRPREVFGLGRSFWEPRLRSAVIVGTEVRILDPVATLIHLAVHAALSGGHRLIWLSDVQRAVLRYRPDWDHLCSVAEDTHATIPLHLVLDRARRILGLDVPAEVIRRLAPAGYRAALTLADRLSPLPGAVSGGSLARLIGRSSRQSASASGAEAGRRAAAWARGAVRMRPAGLAHPYDGEDPRSVAFPCGGAAERRAFFDAVAEAADASPASSARR